MRVASTCRKRSHRKIQSGDESPHSKFPCESPPRNAHYLSNKAQRPGGVSQWGGLLFPKSAAQTELEVQPHDINRLLGQRSRLFLARALLQRADLVLLDETFSAFDPETLSRTLPRVLDLAPTLVVIAHP